MTPLSGLAVGLFREFANGQHLKDAVLSGLLYAAIFYVVGWTGTFLINYVWLTPASMHGAQFDSIGRLRGQIESLSREWGKQLKDLKMAHDAELTSVKGNLSAEIGGLKLLLDAEQLKNARPSIRGNLVCATTGIRSDETLPEKAATVAVHFVFTVVNMRPPSTNIAGIRIDGSALKIPAEFENAETWQPPPLGTNAPTIRHPELRHGIYTELAGSAEVSVKGFAWRELGETLSLDGLKIELIDGFGDAHQITVDPETSISV